MDRILTSYYRDISGKLTRLYGTMTAEEWIAKVKHLRLQNTSLNSPSTNDKV